MSRQDIFDVAHGYAVLFYCLKEHGKSSGIVSVDKYPSVIPMEKESICISISKRCISHNFMIIPLTADIKSVERHKNKKGNISLPVR